MNAPIRIELSELPPSVNRLWRAVRGTVIKSPKYRAWLKSAGWTIRVQVRSARISGPYAMQISARRPDKRRRDLDNLAKALSDLLASLNVVDDDSECQSLQMAWVDSGPTLSVLLNPCERVGMTALEAA